MSSNIEDLSPAARIRVAAVEHFGRTGFARTTVRQIAAEAGVSPGLVLHHYGSKDGLREACDDWVIEILSSEKGYLVAGPMPRLDDFVAEHPELAGIMAYLVAALRAGGPMASRVFDRLHAMTAKMLATAEGQGLMRPLADPEAGIAILVAMSCGLMLAEHDVSRHLGGTALTEPAVMSRYSIAALELFTGGLFSPAYADAIRAAADPAPEANPA